MGYVPWHMWGTNHQVRAATTLGAGPGVYTQQLARVDYGRPDTWHFLFWAQLNQYVGLGGSFCDVYFDLIVGLGRSSVRIDSFEHFKFENAGTPPAAGLTIFSTEAQGPLRFAGDTTPNILDDFPAQSINCVARVIVGVGSGANVLADLTLFAGFAPKTHIRPEWLRSGNGALDSNKFRGGEQAGT